MIGVPFEAATQIAIAAIELHIDHLRNYRDDVESSDNGLFYSNDRNTDLSIIDRKLAALIEVKRHLRGNNCG